MGSMQQVLLFISRALLAFLDTLSTILGALGIRWLLGYSTPERDWDTFTTWWRSVVAYVVLPDPLADINLGYLTRLRERWEGGWYTADTTPEDAYGAPDHTRDMKIVVIVADSASDSNNTEESEVPEEDAHGPTPTSRE